MSFVALVGVVHTVNYVTIWVLLEQNVSDEEMYEGLGTVVRLTCFERRLFLCLNQKAKHKALIPTDLQAKSMQHLNQIELDIDCYYYTILFYRHWLLNVSQSELVFVDICSIVTSFDLCKCFC